MLVCIRGCFVPNQFYCSLLQVSLREAVPNSKEQGNVMTESITQPEMGRPDDGGVETVEIPPISDRQISVSSVQFSDDTSEPSLVQNSTPIIWTPRFVVIFALTLVIGLSIASLLTQGMLNGYYPPQAILLTLVIFALGGWIAVAIFVRSLWLRVGGIFGCIWAVFMGIYLVVSLLPIDPTASILLHLNASTNSALLGSYICLSIDHTPFHRWDGWFFRLAPLLGVGAVAAGYFLLPSDISSLRNLENTTVSVTLILCILIWWIRPSCWRSQPGVTFLFGAAPFILCLLTLPGIKDREGHFFFFTQVALLSLLLGIMRVLQEGIVGRRATR